jgi:DNA-binding response OmpR family regulator
MQVLLVEDDFSLADALSTMLGLAGFDTRHVATAADALHASVEADVVLLDLGLPDLDGVEVCRTLRARSDVAIVMLTGRAEQADKLLGFEVGADDYVVKPFHDVELLARLRAISRRLAPVAGWPGGADGAAGAPAMPGNEPSGTGTRTADSAEGNGGRCGAQRLGPLTVDRRSRRVHLDGTEIGLTAREFDVLAYLALEPGMVRSRDELLTELWDAHWFGPTKTVDVHVASVRRKLGDRRWIEAVRGIGFRLEIPPPGAP